jgi:uncharacterized radical SAM protein YgiQ
MARAPERKPAEWLPTTLKEVKARGWEVPDVVLFSGDAYVDHPSFAAAAIGRTLEKLGLKVALVPQPNWRDDRRDFRKLGKPRLFFAVSAGAMDSMVNKYTANKRLRSNDAYTPDARTDMRPDYPTVVYSQILKELYPDVPVIVGGIEASMRRLAHYDYWQDKLLPSIAVTSRADLLVYGCGEEPIANVVKALQKGANISELTSVPQTVFVREEVKPEPDDRVLFSYEDCLRDRKKQAQNFRWIEEESNRLHARRLLQLTGKKWVVVNPPCLPMTAEALDACYDLPYTRLPHPKYQGKRIPAYEMIRHSITVHRGCFGGCAFCTISAHQGKFIASRSVASILKEVRIITQMPDFKGYLSDLGGPSANMYGMKGKDGSLCAQCKKPSCIFPAICKNLNADHRPLLDLYHAVDRIPEVKKSFISSGVRYDLLIASHTDEQWNRSARDYTQELIVRHTSGRLKVAPEHTAPDVLKCIRKPAADAFHQFKKIFDRINKEYNLHQQLIPYFMSSHPACTETDMAELALIAKNLDFRPEQVQDFTPTPMTLSSEIFYTGYHPYTMQPVYTAKTQEEKLNQRQYFFWYNRDYKERIIRSLHRLNRPDLIKKLYANQRGTPLGIRAG